MEYFPVILTASPDCPSLASALRGLSPHPARSRLLQVAFHCFASLVRASPRKLRGLRPLNLGIQNRDRRVKVTSVKRRVRITEL